MGLKIYSATKLNAKTNQYGGAILDVSFNSKDESIWFNLKKQTGVNVGSDGRTSGIYKDGASVAVKFSIHEAGSLLYAIKNKSEYSVPHNESSIRFNYWSMDPTTPGAKPREGFSLSVKKDNVDFKSTFNLGTAETLAEYLRFALEHIFSAIYAADKKFYEDGQKNKKTKPTADSSPRSETVEADEVI